MVRCSRERWSPGRNGQATRPAKRTAQPMAHSGAHETNQALERFRNNGPCGIYVDIFHERYSSRLSSSPCSTALCCAEPTAVSMKTYRGRKSRLPCLLLLGLLVALLRPLQARAVAARSESLPHDESAPLGDFSGSRKLANSGEVVPPTSGTSHLVVEEILQRLPTDGRSERGIDLRRSVGQCGRLTQAFYCSLSLSLSLSARHIQMRELSSPCLVSARQSWRSSQHLEGTRQGRLLLCQLLKVRSVVNMEHVLFSYGSLVTVSALMDLFSATNGSHWANNANWLVGDPCANSWALVTCIGGLITEMYVTHPFTTACYQFTFIT